MNQKYEYCIVGCASDIAPTLTHIALVSCSDTDVLSIPECLPFKGEWGKNETMSFGEELSHLLPQGVHIIYLSIVERKFYMVNAALPKEEIYHMWCQGHYEKIIVGMAPYGGIAVWLNGIKKSTLVKWLYGFEIKVNMSSFIPGNPDVSLDELKMFYINSNLDAKIYYKKHGVPPHTLFEGYMQQFTYHYQPLYEYWDENNKEWRKWEKYAENVPVFDFIEESLYDGTHDKLHDGGLMKYHQAGKPKKLRVEWHIGKSEYSAYFWFEDERIREVFDRFYGAHPDTKTDFIIRIDAEKRKYELALYRYGLKEPQVIPEDVYQLLVFKNKFEDYRSDNYNQERGAWIW